MKACILLFAVLTAFSARSAQSETSPAGRATTWLSGGVTVKQTYPGMPWLDYSKLPWFKQPSTENSANPETLLANLKDDLEAAVSGLSTLTNSLVNESQNATEDGNVIAIADENFNGLASRDFSTLLSQDLSVQCGQLLSTSLAVPTSLPWCPWGNR